MISTIQEETGRAIESTNKEIKAVDEGVALAEEAGNSLNDIMTQVHMVNSVVTQIATASEEQSVAADQISSDIESVSKITSETSESAKQIASLGSEIDSLASSLRSTVEKFKVSGSTPDIVSTDTTSKEIDNVEILGVDLKEFEDDSEEAHLSLLSN